jgi:hypothetical protein
MMCFYSTKQGKRRFLQDDFQGSIYDCPHHGEEARSHKRDSDAFDAVVKRLGKTGLQTEKDYQDFHGVLARLKYAPLPKEQNLWQTVWKDMPPSRTSLEDFMSYDMQERHNIRAIQGLMSPRIPDDIEHLDPNLYRHLIGKEPSDISTLEMPYGHKDLWHVKPAYPGGNDVRKLSNNAEEGRVYQGRIVKEQKAPSPKPSSHPSPKTLAEYAEQDKMVEVDNLEVLGTTTNTIDSLIKDVDFVNKAGINFKKYVGKTSKAFDIGTLVIESANDLAQNKTIETVRDNLNRNLLAIGIGVGITGLTVAALADPYVTLAITTAVTTMLSRVPMEGREKVIQTTSNVIKGAITALAGSKASELYKNMAPKVEQKYNLPKPKPKPKPWPPGANPKSMTPAQYYRGLSARDPYAFNDFFLGNYPTLHAQEKKRLDALYKKGSKRLPLK